MPLPAGDALFVNAVALMERTGVPHQYFLNLDDLEFARVLAVMDGLDKGRAYRTEQAQRKR